MSTAWNRQRTYATLVGLGICILLFRTIAMLTDGSLTMLVWWVSALLVLEFLLNVGTFLSAIWWWIAGTETRASLPLRFTAAAVILHAVRVLIYALGDVGPWPHFDVRPAYRATQLVDLTWVVFASTMAALSLVALFVIWRVCRRRTRS